MLKEKEHPPKKESKQDTSITMVRYRMLPNGERIVAEVCENITPRTQKYFTPPHWTLIDHHTAEGRACIEQLKREVADQPPRPAKNQGTIVMVEYIIGPDGESKPIGIRENVHSKNVVHRTKNLGKWKIIECKTPEQKAQLAHIKAQIEDHKRNINKRWRYPTKT